MLRERKPTRTVLATLVNDKSEHSYNLSIKMPSRLTETWQ